MTESSSERPSWEDSLDRVVTWAPYVTLALSVVVAVLTSRENLAHQAATLGLAVAAGLWVWFLYTRGRLESRIWTGVYFAGLILVAFLLMQREWTFFIFTITGFFHAYLLRPGWAVVLGVLATSLVINSMIVAGSPGTEDWWIFTIVVVIQTGAISAGITGGEKISRLSEERRLALVELEAAQAENARLQDRLISEARRAGVADERRRLAGEIHDTLAQGLTGIITQLEAAGHQQDPAEVRRHVDNAARLARESLSEARRSVQDLVPTHLDGQRLHEALKAVIDDWSSLHDLSATFTTTGAPHDLEQQIETNLLRVAQEALANVANHARATRVAVTLSYMDDVVALDVRDDGVGFDVGTPTDHDGGFGLPGMRRRVEGLAGELQVESEQGVGTAVSVRLPSSTEAVNA